LSAASVEDIAEAAGYTRGAFYSNFSSKGDLFIELLRRDVPTLGEVIWIGNSPPARCVSYEALLAAAQCTEPEVEIAESDPHYFNLTSGTTGLPKAYVVSHYNNATLLGSMVAFGVASEDVILTVFPAPNDVIV